MKLYSKQFLGLDSTFTAYEPSAVVVLPITYEGGISYGSGTAKGPEAVIEASNYLELYDESLAAEPYRLGIATVRPPDTSADPAEMQKTICHRVLSLLEDGKFVVAIGGDHSISTAYVKALHTKYHRISVIQLDAHADLRDVYDNSPFSHACVMSRIREITTDTLQIGIRSLSLEEARRIENENMVVCTMSDLRSKKLDVAAALDQLPDPVFLTVDVDVFDWSIVRSTGTPEPGGLLWDEAMALLRTIFNRKNIIGFDVVELSYDRHDRNSPFAVAKLVYKMLGFKLDACVRQGALAWPDKPHGSLLRD